MKKYFVLALKWLTSILKSQAALQAGIHSLRHQLVILRLTCPLSLSQRDSDRKIRASECVQSNRNVPPLPIFTPSFGHLSHTPNI